MSLKDNKAVVQRFIEEVWGAGNLNLVDKLVADEHVHHLSRRDVKGPDGVKELVIWFHKFLPDVQVDIHDLIAEGQKVVIYFRFNGTDTGGYRNHPPSGKHVTYDGIDIFRLSDGMITERWGIVDTVSLLYQIDAIS